MGDYLQRLVAAGKRFIACESGSTALEYGLLAAFIGIALVNALVSIGGGIGGYFSDVASFVK